MVYDEVVIVIKKLCISLLRRYQIGLEKSMKSSDFIFYMVHELYCKCSKINLNGDGSYADSPDWIKTKEQQYILSIMMINFSIRSNTRIKL